MINFLLYTHEVRDFQLFVATADDVRRNVELKYELPEKVYTAPNDHIYGNGEAKVDYCQRFKLQPNTYIFALGIKLIKNDLNDRDVKFLMKIGSVSECTIKELKSEHKTEWFCVKNKYFK